MPALASLRKKMESQMTWKQDERERLLRILASATFLIFFQAYMVAPLIPRLATMFSVSEERIGLFVPAYMIPYGIATLFYGVLADRIGRRRVLLASLTAFIALTALTATAQTGTQLVMWRLAIGLGASGVVPLALSLIGQLFPYEQRGRPLGWLFGAMAGGMAFGSTVGVLAEPLLGWRALFGGVALLVESRLFFFFLTARSWVERERGWNSRQSGPDTEAFLGRRAARAPTAMFS